MDSKITSTKGAGRRTGFALSEMMVAMGISGLLFMVVCAFSMFAGRSFAALYNYVDLDDDNRIAIDQLTRDVRQAMNVAYFSSNYISLAEADGININYQYDPVRKLLTRTKGSEVTVLLKECERLRFAIGQRNTDVGGYDVFKAATIDTAKVLNVSWMCSRSLFGRVENTESVQTARIVIRKQGT